MPKKRILLILFTSNWFVCLINLHYSTSACMEKVHSTHFVASSKSNKAANHQTYVRKVGKHVRLFT